MLLGWQERANIRSHIRDLIWNFSDPTLTMMSLQHFEQLKFFCFIWNKNQFLTLEKPPMETIKSYLVKRWPMKRVDGILNWNQNQIVETLVHIPLMAIIKLRRQST